MFLTITIDTTQQKKQKLKVAKKSAFVTKGWRANITPIKKPSFWQRISSLKKKIGGGIYKLGEQTTIF